MTQTETRPQTRDRPQDRRRGQLAAARRDARALHGVRRQQRRARRTPTIGLELHNQRGLCLPADRSGRPGHGPRLRHRRPGPARRAPRRPLRRAGRCSRATWTSASRHPPRHSRWCAGWASPTSVRPPPPPQEHLPKWRRAMEGLRHSMSRDAEVIAHHYDVSNTFYEYVLGPSMTYTCAVYESPDATLEEAQFAKYDLICRKLDLEARPAAARRRLRLGRHGPARRPRVRRAQALGVTLSRQQAQWAKEAIDREGLGDLAEVRHLDYRDVLESGFDAVSSIGLTEHIGVRNYPAYFAFLRDRLRPEGRLLNHCITRTHNHRQEIGAVPRPLRLPGRRADRVRPDHHRGAERRPRGDARGELPQALRAHARRLVPQPAGELGRVRRARSARARRGSGASTWPARGWPSSATRSSCTTCSPPAPPTTGRTDSRCVPTLVTSLGG